MFGQHSPVNAESVIPSEVAALRARVAELERVAGAALFIRPATGSAQRILYGGTLAVTTDTSGDFTVTAAALGMSSIESLVGNLNGTGAVVLASVRQSGSNMILRFRNLSDGSVFASSSTNVRIIAVGTPA